ncbi:MAG: hypothetical protein ABI621_03840 [Chloroflexota bacterium]
MIVGSPYRLFLEPLFDYINDILSSRQANETITIVVPHFVSGQKIQKTLHMQTAEMLRRELLATPGVVITEVPYQISDYIPNSTIWTIIMIAPRPCAGVYFCKQLEKKC